MADELSKADKWKLVRGTNLKSADRHCLVTLFLFQGENGTAFCKQETLADEIGVSTRSIRKSLHRLNAAGIIVSAWQVIRSVPMRTYSIDFAKLKSVQRADGRNHSSAPEPCDGRNHSSAGVGTTVPDHQETQFLQEDPLNIQGTSTIGKSPISMARSGRKPKVIPDSKLTAFCTAWNNWHSAGIVRQRIRDAESPGKTIVAAWNRSQGDSEQREHLKDLAAIRAMIAASQQLLKPARWFDAAGLIGGKNANRRWYLERLLSGVYADRPKPESPAVDGVPEAKQAWQKILNAAKEHHGNAAGFESEIGPELTEIVRALGLTRQKIDQASTFDRREQEREFIQAFDRQEVVA